MPRSIRMFLPVPGDPDTVAAAFNGDPLRWLPKAQRNGDVYSATVRAGSFSRTVAVTVGHPWSKGATRWRSLCWDPLSDDGGSAAFERFLPSFDGELGLHVHGPDRMTLVLDGRYSPPGGPLGTALDAVALHRVAQVTVERLLADVAARLSAESLLLDGRPSPVGIT